MKCVFGFYYLPYLTWGSENTISLSLFCLVEILQFSALLLCAVLWTNLAVFLWCSFRFDFCCWLIERYWTHDGYILAFQFYFKLIIAVATFFYLNEMSAAFVKNFNHISNCEYQQQKTFIWFHVNGCGWGRTNKFKVSIVQSLVPTYKQAGQNVSCFRPKFLCFWLSIFYAIVLMFFDVTIERSVWVISIPQFLKLIFWTKSLKQIIIFINLWDIAG